VASLSDCSLGDVWKYLGGVIEMVFMGRLVMVESRQSRNAMNRYGSLIKHVD
jgi:hypothetical protein